MLYVFLIVALTIIALIGWYLAWRNGRHSPGHIGSGSQTVDLGKIESQATDQLAASIQQASELFQKNLTVQALKINDELESLAGRRLQQQVQDFSRVLDGLTTTATASVAQLENLVDQRRQSLEASLSTEVTEEKQQAIERFYGRLSDIVASYVIQSLGNDIDLSSQLPFVTKVLEQNKDAIKQDLSNDY